jgi:hypothetical protein
MQLDSQVPRTLGIYVDRQSLQQGKGQLGGPASKQLVIDTRQSNC